MEIKSTDSLNKRGFRGWIGCFIVLLGLPFLLYFSYCWGVWGRSSLLLQHYFQCKCPPVSEQARYPEEAEILFSACHYINVHLSPSGRFLLVREENSGKVTYLLNLETMQKTPTESVSSFLTDEIAFTQKGLDDFILELFTGKRYPIQEFRYWRTDAYIDGKPNLELLVDTLRQADEIYLTDNYGTVVVLMAEFPENMEKSFTFDQSNIPSILGGSDRAKQFLIVNRINYIAVPASYPGEVVSPDGRFLARDDGIYLTKTNEKIIEGAPRLYVRGWTVDSSGAIYTSHFFEPCLLRLSIPIVGDDSWCEIRVPQPVIKLKIPEEYR